MRRLRIVIYFIPLILIFLVYHFLASLTYYETADRNSLTFAITDEPIGIDPLTEQDPVSEEIESLLFDTLLGRSPEMELEGRLAESWSYDAQARYFFDSERYARESWEEFSKDREPWKAWGIADAELNGTEVRIAFDHRRAGVAEEILAALPAEHLAPITVWQIQTEHSAEPSFRNYLEGAVEGWQVRRTWSEAPDMVEVLSAGKTENFLRELEIYYSSNPQLDARLKVIDEIPYLYEPRMRINLRSGVVWHDGHAFSVEDVVHSIQQARTSRLEPMVVSGLREILSIEASGPLSLLVNYRHETAQNLEIWEQLRILPAHGGHIYNPANPSLLIGTGPFFIRQWTPESPIILERNPNYYRGEPENHRLVYEQVLDNRLLRLLFQTGAIDSYRARPTSYSYIENHPDFTLSAGPAVEHVRIAWNLDHFLFADPRIRLALAHATDARSLRRDLLAGEGKPVNRLIHPGVLPGLEPIEEIAYNAKRANELLDEAGWADMRFGIRYKGRTPLSFRLTLVGADEFQRELARSLQQDWRQFGIQVQLQMATHADVSRIQTSSEDFEAALIVRPLDPYVDLYGRWHSSEVGPGRGNFSHLRDVTVDDLLTQIRSSSGPEETERLFGELQQQLMSLQPCLQVALRDSARVFRKDRVQVVDKSRRGAETPEVRDVGANSVSLGYDLAWWVKSVVEPEMSAEPVPSVAVVEEE